MLLSSLNACITNANIPAVNGDAMLVPPKTPHACFVLSICFALTGNGVYPYAPVASRSGFTSPITVGPLLEKSAISS